MGEKNTLKLKPKKSKDGQLQIPPTRQHLPSAGRVDELEHRRLDAEIEATVRLPLGGWGSVRPAVFREYVWAVKETPELLRPPGD